MTILHWKCKDSNKNRNILFLFLSVKLIIENRISYLHMFEVSDSRCCPFKIPLKIQLSVDHFFY